MAGDVLTMARCSLQCLSILLVCLSGNAAGVAPTQSVQLPGYPEGQVIDSATEPLQARQFVLGPVERKRREVRIAAFRTIQASLRSTTYELPRSASVDSIAEHYRQLLSGRLVYECEGRDCGRSNDWANTVFGRSDLYGPDGNQRYLAADLGTELVAVYLIRRGNQRLYAHVVAYQPQTPLNLQPVAGSQVDAVKALALHGRFLVNEVRPAVDGALSDADLAHLGRLGEQLQQQAMPPIYAVCHLHPPARPPRPAERQARSEALIDTSAATAARVEASQRCAAAAAEAMSGAGLQVIPFGVGPLAPTMARPYSHLELILPPAD